MPLRIHNDQICLFVSKIHSPIQVSDYVVHKMDQLGFARPLTPEVMLIDVVNKCFRVWQHKYVNDAVL